jgi:hypothetical protein
MRTRVDARVIPVVGLLVLLCGPTNASQIAHDHWKLTALSDDLFWEVRYSLADALVNKKEQQEIYRQVDAGLRSDGLVDDERPDQEREIVMGSRVGLIQLARKGKEQILVLGARVVCGNGGCPLWIFVRRRGTVRLVLRADGGALLLRNTMSHGFHDLVTVGHGGGGEAGFTVYSWNGQKYVEVDSYIQHDD